jgi:hypothetical protein
MRFIFRLFTSNKTVPKKMSELENKITFLDTRINEVKNEVTSAINAAIKNEVASAVHAAVKNEVTSAVHAAVKSFPATSEKKEKGNSTTIQIDHLQVDKIVIEHLDYANNFGQLGIKELSGKLNIGSTYEGDISEKMNQIVKEKLGNQAKVNFRAKKDE